MFFIVCIEQGGYNRFEPLTPMALKNSDSHGINRFFHGLIFGWRQESRQELVINFHNAITWISQQSLQKVWPTLTIFKVLLSGETWHSLTTLKCSSKTKSNYKKLQNGLLVLHNYKLADKTQCWKMQSCMGENSKLHCT